MSLVDSIPQTIKEIGRARAQGAASSGALWGQTIADVGQEIGQIPARQQQLRSGALREQELKLAVAAKQRQAAADEALQSATSAALNPDGTINTGMLTQHLAGTPAASEIPKIVESLNRMMESGNQLRIGAKNAGDAEADALGASAHAASLAADPKDKAGILLTGLASGVKSGSIQNTTAQTEIAHLMGDDGQPDPTKIDAAITRLVGNSKEQRTLKDTDTRAASQAASADALGDERKARAWSLKLGNLANQLSQATSPEDYARRFAGVPEEYRSYFDAPEAYTPESPKRAGLVLMTPAERLNEDYRNKQLGIEQGRVTIDKQRLGVEQTRADTEKEREQRLGKPGGDADPDYKRYKDYVSEYQRGATESRERAGKVPVDPADPYGPQKPDVGTYQPPPSYEKWRVMTPQERANTMRDPNLRITDAEMVTRQGGAPAVTAPAPAPARAPGQPPTAAPAASAPAQPSGALIVSQATLEAIAKKRGTTVEVQRKRYIDGHYTVVK